MFADRIGFAVAGNELGAFALPRRRHSNGLKRAIAKVAKITTLQCSCRGAYCVQRWYDGSFQTRPATQRVSARRSGIANTHFATVLCAPAARRTSRTDR
jgi:hypothetical protein